MREGGGVFESPRKSLRTVKQTALWRKEMNKLSSTIRKVYEFEHRISLWRKRSSMRIALTAIAESALRVLTLERLEGLISHIFSNDRV